MVPSWGQLGPFFGHDGAISGPSRAMLWPFWGILGFLGPSWGHLGPFGAFRGPLWAIPGPFRGYFGTILAYF